MHQEDNQEALERFKEKFKKDFNLDFCLIVIGSVFGHISPFDDAEDPHPGITPLSLNMSKSRTVDEVTAPLPRIDLTER